MHRDTAREEVVNTRIPVVQKTLPSTWRTLVFAEVCELRGGEYISASTEMDTTFRDQSSSKNYALSAL